MQVWNRPPLPKASPLPRNRTFTFPIPILLRVQGTRQRLPKLVAPYQNLAHPGGSDLPPAPRLAVSRRSRKSTAPTEPSGLSPPAGILFTRGHETKEVRAALGESMLS